MITESVYKMALQGIKVIEIANVQSVSVCCQYLADFGATIYRVSKEKEFHTDYARAGKIPLTMNIKDPICQEQIRKLARNADVIVEGLRPGKMASLGLGPEDLQRENPRLIFVHFSGFGQTGPYAQKSAHDPNFAALSGVLSMLGDRTSGRTALYPPMILTMACSSVLCAFGILAAIIGRERTGLGQILDHSTIAGAAYGSFYLFHTQDYHRLWYKGSKIFLFDIYETKDHKYMSIGALEQPYVDNLLLAVGLDPEDLNSCDSDEMAVKFHEIFRTKTRSEWEELFRPLDVCVAPVLNGEEAAENEHNKARDLFGRVRNKVIPKPTPKLSATPAQSCILVENVADLEEQGRAILRALAEDTYDCALNRKEGERD